MYNNQKIQKLKLEYTDQWKRSSENFAENGHYKWMADFVKGYNKVLEVGTGDGKSTKQLLENGHTVISIDENEECLKAAKSYLENAGYQVILLERQSIQINSPYSYTISYSPITPIENNYNALLIQSDIANDPHLYAWLKDEKIDAVLCWLIGTHGARAFNSYVSENGNPQTPAHYRILTQNRVYEVADEVLVSGKILHIVDRGISLDEYQLEQLRLCHEDQASVTRLKISDIDSRSYAESNTVGAMKMISTNQATGEVIHNSSPTLHSIVSKMP